MHRTVGRAAAAALPLFVTLALSACGDRSLPTEAGPDAVLLGAPAATDAASPDETPPTTDQRVTKYERT